jgi:hypothetical protein
MGFGCAKANSSTMSARSRIGRVKAPPDVEFVAELPKTSTCKTSEIPFERPRMGESAGSDPRLSVVADSVRASV